MSQQNEVLMTAIIAAIPKYVSLNYIDYNDELTESQLKPLNNVLNLSNAYSSFVDELYDDCSDWIIDNAHSTISDYYLGEVKSNLSKQQVNADIDNILEEYDDFIRDALYDKNDSNPIRDLISNTSDQSLRVEMQSNEEGLRGWYNLKSIEYEGYMKHVIDVLKLNPALVKQALITSNFTCCGRWPNRKNRIGQEYVTYAAFVVEISNTTSNCNVLTFVGKLDVGDTEAYTGLMTFPAGNNCGLFDSACGAGGVMEMELLRDFSINFKKAQFGETWCDKFVAMLDDTVGYSIDSVYGVTNCFWGDNVVLK